MLSGTLAIGIAIAEVIIAVIQVRNGGGSDKSSTRGGSEKWSDFICILKVELIGFVDESDVRFREVNVDYKCI